MGVEDKFNKPGQIENPKTVEIEMEEKMRRFGRLLSMTRMRSIPYKSRSAMARELGLIPQSTSKWEGGETFPVREKLPDVANAYGIDLAELTKTFEISKEACGMKNKSRIRPNHTEKTHELDFPTSRGWRNGPKR